MLLRVALAFILVLTQACDQRSPQATPTEREAHLLKILSADPHLLVHELHRGSDGILTVVTRQGSEFVQYRFVPEGDTLRIAHLEHRVVLPGSEDSYNGTGPDPRGLAAP